MASAALGTQDVRLSAFIKRLAHWMYAIISAKDVNKNNNHSNPERMGVTTFPQSTCREAAGESWAWWVLSLQGCI